VQLYPQIKTKNQYAITNLSFHAAAGWSKEARSMPKLVKVVHVMRRFVPEKWGGTEAVVHHVSQGLMERGIESPVHCTAMLANAGADVFDSVPVRRHRYSFPWFGLSDSDREALALKGGSPLSLPLFAGLLRERNVSIIHTHVQHRLGGMARTAARFRGIPYVVSIHGGFFTLPRGQIDTMRAPFAGRLEWGRVFGALFGSRRVLQDANGIICVGQAEYEEVCKRFPEKRVYLVPNGVDVQHFAEADGRAFREAHGFGPSEKIVLCVSRIDSQKNQAGLVRAFGAFSERFPDHRLVLIGPVSVPAYKEEVAAEIRRLGLQERVTVVEGMRPDDPLLASAYKAAEMVVLPSVYEPFGIVVLEAWAAGRPVLASRVGGIPGFAEERKTALLVEPGSEQELTRGMEELAADEALRAELSEAAFATVSAGYDWSHITVRLIGIYEELIVDGASSHKEKIGNKTGVQAMR
jgi:glycosyltransferase involved in cell wall biosynthesis